MALQEQICEIEIMDKIPHIGSTKMRRISYFQMQILDFKLKIQVYIIKEVYFMCD